MEKVSLQVGQIFYGLALGGNHQQSCLFVNPGDLFLAFFDEIYSSDLVGEGSYFLKPNTAYSSKFRFENALRIFQYRVTEDITDIEEETGLLKIPVWSTENQQSIPLVDFKEWLSLITRNELYRENYPVQMYDLSKHGDDLDIIDAHIIDTGTVFKYFYKLISEGRGPQDIKELFGRRLTATQEDEKEIYNGEKLFERDLTPEISFKGVSDKHPSVQELLSMIEDNEDIKTLYRFAALDIETYKYVQTEHFYQVLWNRDLNKKSNGEVVIPEFYSPWLGFAWNYNRLLDLETVKMWLETRKKISKASSLIKNERLKKLVRFDLEELKKMKEISMVGACYKTRVIITANLHSDRLTLVSNAQFMEKIISTFVYEGAKWIKIGYVPDTAVPKPSFLELRLENDESQIFMESFLNYIVREKLAGAFRFG